jgi:hypothetical protein
VAESNPQDRFVTPGSTGGSSAAFPRWSAARHVGADDLDPTPLLLPGPDESPTAYLARLQALHQRLGALITTIEQRREVRPQPPAPRIPLSASAALSAPPAPVLPPPAPRPQRPPAAPFEQGPVWPEHERRVGIERRLGAPDRRHGLGDRRRGASDTRMERVERRSGARDRRTGAMDRRRGLERRRVVNSLPWDRGGLRLNATTMVWVVQVLAWAAIAAVALVYGLGHT